LRTGRDQLRADIESGGLRTASGDRRLCQSYTRPGAGNGGPPRRRGFSGASQTRSGQMREGLAPRAGRPAGANWMAPPARRLYGAGRMPRVQHIIPVLAALSAGAGAALASNWPTLAGNPQRVSFADSGPTSLAQPSWIFTE